MSQNTESILEFPENIKLTLRKRYGFDQPGSVDDALDIIEEWIRKHNYLTKKKYDRHYLETCLITCKGSIERTKTRVERLCYFRTFVPDLFTEYRADRLFVGLEKMITEQSEKDKVRYDKGKAKLTRFEKGEYGVFKEPPRLGTKLRQKYDDPFEVKKVLPYDRCEMWRINGRGRSRKSCHEHLRSTPNFVIQSLMAMSAMNKYVILGKTDADEFTETSGGLLPKMDMNNCRVFILKDNGCAFSTEIFKNFYRFCILIGEYLRQYDYSDGYIFVFDLTNGSLMEMVSAINLLDMRNIFSVLMEGYGLRLKGIHLLTSPSTLGNVIDLFVGILRSMVSKKIGDRIHVHKTLDSFYEQVPREILPKEYEGKEDMTMYELRDKWIRVLTSPETLSFFKEIFESKVYESIKQTKSFQEDHLGLPGSFRKLNVD